MTATCQFPDARHASGLCDKPAVAVYDLSGHTTGQLRGDRALCSSHDTDQARRWAADNGVPVREL